EQALEPGIQLLDGLEQEVEAHDLVPPSRAAQRGHSPTIGKCVKPTSYPNLSWTRSRTGSSSERSTSATAPQRSQARYSCSPPPTRPRPPGPCRAWKGRTAPCCRSVWRLR